jgi:hypothetical protein
MKETLEYLFTPLKEAVASRLASPLTSSYVISWSLWNYKLIMIVFSSNSISTTFDLIDKHIFPNATATFMNLFAPFALAIFYLYGYQKLSNWIHKDQTTLQIGHQNELKEATKGALLTLEESMIIQGEMIALRLSKDTEITDLRRQQIELELVVKTQAEKLAKFESGSDKKQKELLLSEEESTILTVLGAHQKLDDQQLKQISGIPTLPFDYFIKKLLDQKYVAEIPHEDSLDFTIYELTQAGRFYVLNREKSKSSE